MKKQLLGLLLMVLPAAFAQAQPISVPGGEFENWHSFSYSQILGWSSSNEYVMSAYGDSNVTKVPGVTNFAARLETKAFGTDTLTGDLYIGMDGNGVPFSQKPTAFTGQFRYNIGIGDTALIGFMFVKNGIPITMEPDVLKITGSQSTFTSFSLPVTALPVNPDTVYIFISSSNTMEWVGVMPGSWLEVDDLAFTGPGVTQTIPEAGVDNWSTLTEYEMQDGWQSYNSGNVTRTTDKYSGTYAASLEHANGSDAGMMFSQFNGGGMSFSNTTDTLTGYYKYSTVSPDSAVIRVMLFDNGTPVNFGIEKRLAPAATYTYFEVPIHDTTTHDMLDINISSHDYSMGAPANGTVLKVDKLQLKNPPVSVGKIAINKANLAVYPNPVGDVMHIRMKGDVPQFVDVVLYDVSGKVVFTSSNKTNGASVLDVPVSQLVKGVYYYELKTEQGSVKDKLLKW